MNPGYIQCDGFLALWLSHLAAQASRSILGHLNDALSVISSTGKPFTVRVDDRYSELTGFSNSNVLRSGGASHFDEYSGEIPVSGPSAPGIRCTGERPRTRDLRRSTSISTAME